MAIAASTFYGLMRAIVLTCTDGAAFAWLTALPPIVLFALAVGGASPGAWTLAVAFAGTWLAAAGFLRAVVVPPRAPARDGHGARDDRCSGSSPSTALVQGLCQSGAVFGTILAIQTLGGTVHDVGQFTVASLAIVGPNLFVAMIAPLLFNRWARTMTRTGRHRLIRQTSSSPSPSRCWRCPSCRSASTLLTAIFGDDYHDGAVAMTPLLLAVFPLIVTRVVAPALQATGDTSVVTVTWAVRLAAPWILLPRRLVDDVVLWATLATACGEYAAMARCSRWRGAAPGSRPISPSACG